MKPSLLKHTGCDIIDINPGVGVWSSAVHDLLKPRNHYLMEPDYELYTPLLQPLLDKEGSTYKLIPKSGATWGQLNSLLSPASLPQQVELKAGDPRLNEPNDTLLVMANLGWHPKKPYRAFPSVSMLLIHQLLSAIRAHSLFHRYGLIRMLVWFSDDEGKQILPRNISARRKMAIEAEVSCSGIYEIASSTLESPAWKRDETINVESSRRVLKKMEKAGITTPEGRESVYQLQATKRAQQQNPEDERLAVRRSWEDELQELQKKFAAGCFTEFADAIPRLKPNPEMKRLRTLRKWFEKGTEAGTIPTQGKTLRSLQELEAKFEAGSIREYVDADTVPKIRQRVNPEWQRLRTLRLWFEARTKKGNAPTKGKMFRDLQELEVRLKAGELKQYLEFDPNKDAIGQEKLDARNSEQMNKSPEPTKPGRKGKERDGHRIRRLFGFTTKRTEEFERMRRLEIRLDAEHKIVEKAIPVFEEFESVLEMQRKVRTLEGPDNEALQLEIDERIAEFNAEVETLGRGGETFRHRLDNRRTFSNDPPILYWDKREAEPLQVRPDEFYPKHGLCLLDFYPAPLWPALQKYFPESYDIFEHILSTMFMTSTQSVKSALTAVAPGAFEWLQAECPSLTDMDKGGNPNLDFLSVRCLTLEMFKEIMSAWMRWPFRPDRFELLKKSGSAAYDPDEEAHE